MMTASGNGSDNAVRIDLADLVFLGDINIAGCIAGDTL